MADIAETVLYRSDPAVGLKIRLVKAEGVDTNDTITIGELTAVVHAEAFRMDTGASITCTYSGNVVTITETLTDIPVLVCVTGY